MGGGGQRERAQECRSGEQARRETQAGEVIKVSDFGARPFVKITKRKIDSDLADSTAHFFAQLKPNSYVNQMVNETGLCGLEFERF